MEPGCIQTQPLGLHVIFLGSPFVKLPTEKMSTRHSARAAALPRQPFSISSIPYRPKKCSEQSSVLVHAVSQALLPPPAIPVPIKQAFVHTFMLGLFFPALLLGFEFFSSALGVSGAFPISCRPRSHSCNLSLLCFPFHKGFQPCLER